MLEVLITLVIIAIALLGTAGLQVYAMRMGKSSEFRTQAIFLASDIAERMEANKTAAVAGSYATSDTAPATMGVDCGALACDSSNLALYDLSQWEAAIQTLLPQPTWTVTQTTAGNPSTYSIVINWIDRRTNTQYATAGTGETFSYTSTRTVAN
jgi:type IV pilus assembly protein PilV